MSKTINKWLSVLALCGVAMTFQNCKPAIIEPDLGSLKGTVDLDTVIAEKNCGVPTAPAAPLRTLSNDEYKNAVYDVLGVQPDLNSTLPTNILGTSGFRNDAQALGNFDLEHISKFYDAAERVSATLIAGQNNSTSAYFKVFNCATSARPNDAILVTSGLAVNPSTWDIDPDAGSFGAVSNGTGYLLWSNGRLSKKFFAPKTGTYTINLNAQQTPYPGDNSHMIILVNGAVVKEFSVDGDNIPKNYSVSLNLVAGVQNFEILFDNDNGGTVGGVSYDRNLFVNSFTWTTVPSGTALTGDACLRDVFSDMSARLFRMDKSSADILAQANNMIAVTHSAASMDRGLADAIITVLMDPRFMLVAHEAADGKLTGLGLASKISFLIWQSVPDDALRADAVAGKLAEAAVLKAHIKRMLQDDRAKRLAEILRKEWLGLASFESGTFQGLTAQLQGAYVKETSLFLEDMIKSDRPLSWILEANQTFVNKELADMYGLPFPGGTPVTSFVAVSTAGSPRQGIVTQASILAATSGGTEVTHPVRRGVWIADRILCAKPPPPPPGIPSLPTNVTNEGSIRKRLEVHTKAAACAGCHKQIDLYGLGMENYDPFGRWRDRYHDYSNVESYGSDSSMGLEFANSRQLVEQLPKVSQAQACIAESLVRLGQNRAASNYEKCASGAVGMAAFESNTIFSDYVFNLVSSPTFSMQPE